MRTAYCPKTHELLATISVGDPYGHVPGHHFNDVDCIVSHRQGKELVRCHVVQSWGSAQGYDEEHGRREVVGRGPTISAACSDAMSAGKSAGIDVEKLVQAITRARDEAEENIGDDA